MILVLAGTKDGRELAWELAGGGYNVIVSAFSSYGGSLASHPDVKVVTGAMDAEMMEKFITKESITTVVDASHPYALNVTRNAWQACQSAKIRYIRYERPVAPLPDYERLYYVHSAAEAASLAASHGNTVFLTTGSRTLPVFCRETQLKECRIIARVLPEPSVIQECISLGLSPQDIVAMQGPFSHSMNVELLRHYQANVIITKNSGDIGGTIEKVTAAAELGIAVIVIQRPALNIETTVSTVREVFMQLEK